MTASIPFGKLTIGEGLPTVIVAEAACEHLGSLEVALRMVDAAKEAGVDVIKFQLHLPEEMVPGSIQFWGGSMDEVLRRYNLDVDEQAALMQYCSEVGIQYLCTPFSAAAVEALDRIGVDGFKTGSGELTNIPMLQTIARTGKPAIVSTGMATEDEIAESVDALREAGAQFMLTHCTSAYPPAYDQINLRFMPKLAARHNVLVGFSDHTAEPWTALGAVALGAPLIEKHFTLDKQLRGPDWHVSLEPDGMAELVDAVRKLEAALGDEKHVYDDEQVVRAWAHHSIVAAVPIAAGEVITAGSLTMKRPGTGLAAKHLEELIGRRATRDLHADTMLAWSDVEGG